VKNIDIWQPSKFVNKNGMLLTTEDQNELTPSSYLFTGLVGKRCETYIPQYAKGKLIDLGCGKVPLYDCCKNYIEDNICIDFSIHILAILKFHKYSIHVY